MSDKDKNSIIDDLYYNLYGEHQTKVGQALERLTGVAFKVLKEQRKVLYDQQVRAQHSGTVYQIDDLIEDNQKIMVEVKDYTVRNKPVGRADLQKLEGALTDLEIPEGRFVSATDFTNRAKPYAESTKTNPKQNTIELFHVRPSTPSDEEGRIKTILVTIKVSWLDFERGEYIPLINKNFFEDIKEIIPKKGEKQKVVLHNFYDAEGNVVETVKNFTLHLNKRLPEDFKKGYCLEGRWDFQQPVFIEMNPLDRVQIDAIQYKIPAYIEECSFAIDQKGKPVLMIKSEDDAVNKLITDQQLKKYKFEGGEIKKR